MTTEENIKYLRQWLASGKKDESEVARIYTVAHASGMLATMSMNGIISSQQWTELYDEIEEYKKEIFK